MCLVLISTFRFTTTAHKKTRLHGFEDASVFGVDNFGLLLFRIVLQLELLGAHAIESAQ